MQVLEQCEKAMVILTKEIALATGTTLAGQSVGKPRLAGFRLMPEIASKTFGAIDLISEGKPEEGLDLLNQTWRHLQSQQVAYLRNHVLKALTERIKNLIGKVSMKEIDQLYVLFNPFIEYCSNGYIDLTKAAEQYDRLLLAVETISEKKRQEEAAEHQARVECEQAAATREQQRLLSACQRTADQLMQMAG